MLQNTGAVISIAFVMAIVTAAVPKDVLFKIFSGITSGLSTVAARAVHLEHAPGALGARRRSRCSARASRCCGRRTSATSTSTRLIRGGRVIRIGEVAERVGMTPRTIRYYEEIGLLAGGEQTEGHAPPLRRGRRRAARRADAPARPAQPLARRAASSSSRRRRRAPRCAGSSTRPSPTRNGCASSRPHSRTSRRSSSSSAGASTSSSGSRRSSSTSASASSRGGASSLPDGDAGAVLDGADAREIQIARAELRCER